jgi:hypothetical protein
VFGRGSTHGRARHLTHRRTSPRPLLP